MYAGNKKMPVVLTEIAPLGRRHGYLVPGPMNFILVTRVFVLPEDLPEYLAHAGCGFRRDNPNLHTFRV